MSHMNCKKLLLQGTWEVQWTQLRIHTYTNTIHRYQQCSVSCHHIKPWLYVYCVFVFLCIEKEETTAWWCCGVVWTVPRSTFRSIQAGVTRCLFGFESQKKISHWQTSEGVFFFFTGHFILPALNACVFLWEERVFTYYPASCFLHGDLYCVS